MLSFSVHAGSTPSPQWRLKLFVLTLLVHFPTATGFAESNDIIELSSSTNEAWLGEVWGEENQGRGAAAQNDWIEEHWTDQDWATEQWKPWLTSSSLADEWTHDYVDVYDEASLEDTDFEAGSLEQEDIGYYDEKTDIYYDNPLPHDDQSEATHEHEHELDELRHEELYDNHLPQLHQPSAAVAGERPRIVIIIDDMGNSFGLGERAINLPGSITYAFLPFTPASRWLANQAHSAGKEVMLHAPMTSVRRLRLGPGALTTDMAQTDFLNMLRRTIDSIPHVQGINNHMGSHLTQLEEPMHWLMDELGNHDLYFVDSRTAVRSVARELAREAHIPHLSRDIFLDNSRDAKNIAQAFTKLVRLAKHRGLAVGIGHPHMATLDFLEQAILELDDEGIDLVFASEAIETRQLTASLE